MYESEIHDEIFNESIVDETHDSSKQSNGKNEHNTVSEERSVPVAPTHRNEVATNKDVLECAMYESGIHDERFNESTVDETHDSNEQTNGKTEHNTVSEKRSVPVAPTQISEVATSKDILECAMYESGIHDEIFNESIVDEAHDSSKQSNGKNEHNTVSEERSVPVAPTHRNEVATNKDVLECAMYESGIHDERFNESTVDETHDSNEQTNGKTEHNTVSEKRSVPVAPTQISEVATNKDILECAMYESGIHDERFDESNVDINSLVLLDTCENPEFENSKDYSLMPDEVGGDKSSVQGWSTHSKLTKNVSTFWTHLTLSEVAERVDSGYSPGLMKQHHRITAMACHPRKRITSYDPMKVCMVTYSQ